MVRESLSNFRRHARASYVIIRMQGEAEAGRCLVKGDGPGLDSQAVLGRKRKRRLLISAFKTSSTRSGRHSQLVLSLAVGLT